MQLHPAFKTLKWTRLGPRTNEIRSPVGWFEHIIKKGNHLDKIPDLEAIVLMHHYDDYDHKRVDEDKWKRVKAAILKWNLRHQSGKGRIVAAFVGHIHKKNGYHKSGPYDQLDVHRFYAGGADYNAFLALQLFPTGSDKWSEPHFVVYSKVWNGVKWDQRCVHKSGKSASPKCTLWNFDGTVCEFDDSKSPKVDNCTPSTLASHPASLIKDQLKFLG